MSAESLILYDYFSVTAKHHTASSFIDLIGMDITKFVEARSKYGYHYCLKFGNVSVCYGGREDVWLEMTGQGCRAFETHGHGAWDTLFEEVLSDDNYHLTRLDIAFDDHAGLLNLSKMQAETRRGHYISQFKGYLLEESNKGLSIYHGSKKSDLLFRIYDKAAERGRQDEGHWVRFEIQARDNHALEFLKAIRNRPVGKAFIDVVNQYLRYVKPTKDSNKRRWPEARYWKRFIGDAGKLSLYATPGEEYNLGKLERFAITQAGAAAAAYAQIVGEDTYLEKCRQKLRSTMNPRYQSLIQEHLNRAEANSAELLDCIAGIDPHK